MKTDTRTFELSFLERELLRCALDLFAAGIGLGKYSSVSLAVRYSAGLTAMQIRALRERLQEQAK